MRLTKLWQRKRAYSNAFVFHCLQALWVRVQKWQNQSASCVTSSEHNTEDDMFHSYWLQACNAQEVCHKLKYNESSELLNRQKHLQLGKIKKTTKTEWVFEPKMWCMTDCFWLSLQTYDIDISCDWLSVNIHNPEPLFLTLFFLFQVQPSCINISNVHFCQPYLRNFYFFCQWNFTFQWLRLS